MTDYISRKAIKDAVRHRKTDVPITADDNEKFVYAVWNGALDNAGFEIDRIPPADVKPVVRGEWEYWAGGLPKCPVCGYEYADYLECDNFCPNCGADMRPRKEDNNE